MLGRDAAQPDQGRHALNNVFRPTHRAKALGQPRGRHRRVGGMSGVDGKRHQQPIHRCRIEPARPQVGRRRLQLRPSRADTRRLPGNRRGRRKAVVEPISVTQCAPHRRRDGEVVERQRTANRRRAKRVSVRRPDKRDVAAPMNSTSKARLDPSQVEQYKREGYLIYPEAIFGQAKYEALKSHFEEKLARLPADVRPEAMDVPHITDTRLFEWLLSDEVLDLVEPILGPDIALFSSHFICKPKGNGKKVPWHEDSFYWKGMLEPMQVVTVWFAIDPSTRVNGAMQIIPRTFHGFSEYDPVDIKTNVFPTEIKKAMRDESKAVTIELQPNHASLHDGRLMHGSPPNKSSIRRCVATRCDLCRRP